MKKPTLSIITVNFNNRNGLERTIQSIKSQTYTDYEHIIIDANSTDGSKEIILEYSQNTAHLTYWVSERSKWIKDNIPTLIYDALMELDKIRSSEIGSIIPTLMQKKRHSQKRVKKLILLFSKFFK